MPAYVPPALRQKPPSAAPTEVNDTSNVINESDNNVDKAEENLPPAPPHRRNQGRRAHDMDDSELYTLNEIHTHFWPSQLKNTQAPASASAPSSKSQPDDRIRSDEKDQGEAHIKPEAGVSIEPEVETQHQKAEQQMTTKLQPPQQSTLNASEKDPRTLAYVVLFKGANPRWNSGEGIVFAKTGLGLLTGNRHDLQSSGDVKEEIGLETHGKDVGEGAAGHDRQSDASDVSKESEDHGASLGPGGEGESGKAMAEGHESAYGHSSATGASSPTSPATRASNTNIPQSLADTTASSSAEQERQPSPSTSFPKNPIAIFTQFRSQKNRSEHLRIFRFSGNHRITALDILAPRSPELQRMMDQKWNMTQAQFRPTQRGWGKPKEKIRDPEKWKLSLNVPWAVIKFEKCEDGDGGEGAAIPNIDRFELDAESEKVGGSSAGDGAGQKKSVNELLQEMRLGSTA